VRRAGREDVARRLVAASPSTGSYLAPNLLPAVRLASRRLPEAAIDLGQSKFGGSPDLPYGTPWPCWTTPQGERRPLQFFAQVDLTAASAAAPAPLGFPTEGQLSFFADFHAAGEGGITGLYPWERDGSTVLYSPTDVPFVRCSPRIDPLPSGQLLPVGRWTWPSSAPEDTDLPDADYDALDVLEQELEAELRAEVSELWQLSARHQLGGHARFIQHPVEEEVVQALAGVHANGPAFDQAARDRLRAQARDWRVVLQLDSDRTLEVMWGDAGTLWWAARHVDVDAGRWDAGMFNFQCS
jgi:uncharacterized protein YwqG